MEGCKVESLLWKNTSSWKWTFKNGLMHYFLKKAHSEISREGSLVVSSATSIDFRKRVPLRNLNGKSIYSDL